MQKDYDGLCVHRFGRCKNAGTTKCTPIASSCRHFVPTKKYLVKKMFGEMSPSQITVILLVVIALCLIAWSELFGI